MSAPTPNDLGRVITSDRVRQIIYTAYVIAVVVIGAVQVAYAGASVTPEWVTVTQQVLLYLGLPVGGLAAVNTGTRHAKHVE